MSLMRLTPHDKDLGGGFVVRRSLPAAARRAVGPFVFFDHFGPVTESPGSKHDVRPHPHIGLATVTYLFAGAMMHRDSTGVTQRIEPGAVNWMTAGRGIVHSERMPDDLRDTVHERHGLQLWAALPAEHEEDAPSFQHASAAQIPEVALDGVQARVLLGEAHGVRSPIATLSPTLYVDYRLRAGARLVLPAAEERAVYGVDAAFRVGAEQVPAHTMLVIDDQPGEVLLEAEGDTRLVFIGGAALGPRHIWWNFVSSRKERLRQAADDWEAERFAPVAGETERIPLPERRFV